MTSTRRVQRGFTLLELVVVVVLVVLLFVTAIENLLPLRGEAERAALMSTIGGLQSATGLEASRRAVIDSAKLAAMDGDNPMAWLALTPATYVGDIDSYTDLARGQWGYMPGSGILFYRVRYPEYFEGDFDQPAGIRFRVTVDRRNGRMNGIRLAQLDRGEWRMDGSEIARIMEHAQ